MIEITGAGRMVWFTRQQDRIGQVFGNAHCALKIRAGTGADAWGTAGNVEKRPSPHPSRMGRAG